MLCAAAHGPVPISVVPYAGMTPIRFRGFHVSGLSLDLRLWRPDKQRQCMRNSLTRLFCMRHSVENGPMNILVNEDLKAYIDPLSTDEHDALERSLLKEGCRDALVLWGDILVDGHNRYGICQKHGIPFQTLQSKQFLSLIHI